MGTNSYLILSFVILQGDKNIIKFEGDHNSPRPQFYYDSVSIFFYNVLRPPQIPSSSSNKFERYYDLGDLKAGAGNEEVIFFINLTWMCCWKEKKLSVAVLEKGN